MRGDRSQRDEIAQREEKQEIRQGHMVADVARESKRLRLGQPVKERKEKDLKKKKSENETRGPRHRREKGFGQLHLRIAPL